MTLEIEDDLVEIVGQNPYYEWKYLASFLSCWNNTIMGQLNESGYKTQHVPNHDRERLQIVELFPDR